MAGKENFFQRFTSIYTDKSINGWVRGIAWIGTAAVLYVVGSKIVSDINAAKAAQQQAARNAQLDTEIAALENPTDPNATPQKPTFPDSQYSNFADSITTAFTGCATGNILSATLFGILTSAGDVVFGIVKQFQSDIDFKMLQKAFGTRTITKCWFQSDYKDVDLISAVNDQLDVQEIAYINDYISKQGFTFRF